MFTPSVCFEDSMSSTSSVTAQIFYDIGRGIREDDSAKLPVGGAESNVLRRFPLPQATFRTFRFDPLEHCNANIVISRARIVNSLGRTVRNFSPTSFTPAHYIPRFDANGSKMKLLVGPAATDSMVT